MPYFCRRTCVTETSELETAAAICTKDGKRKIIYLFKFISHIIPHHKLHNRSLFLPSKADILPEEKQEIELLEKVLKKALKIRSTSEAHKELHPDSKHPNERKNKALINYTVKEEDKRKLVKSVPLSETYKKPIHHRRAGGNVTHGAPWTQPVLVRKGPTAHPVVNGRPSVPKSTSAKISSTRSLQKMCVKATNAEESSEDNSPSVSCQEVSASGKDGKVTTASVQSKEQWYVYDQIVMFVVCKHEIVL